MQLSADRTVSAPVAFVFESFSDFVHLENLGIERGIEIDRMDNLLEVGAGMSWHVAGVIRRKRRNIDVALNDYTPCSNLAFRCGGTMMDADIQIQFKEVGASKTEVALVIAPEAKNISARLILQSAKLARRSIEGRLNGRLAEFCENIEMKYALS